MNISILTSSKEHPVNVYIDRWSKNNNLNQINIVHSKEELISGDILFLISE